MGLDAIGYLRVSTDEQAQTGGSLDAQAAKITDWCRLNDHRLVEILSDDGISGKSTTNRPGLRRALDLVCERRGVLVVYSLSRLSRSTRDTIELGERLSNAGAQIASWSEKIDTTTAAGTMFFQLLAILAEFERAQLVERTNAVLANKRKKGEALGNAPFGFRNTNPKRAIANTPGMLEPVPAEMVTLNRLLELSDTMNHAEVARALNEAGAITRSGVPWGRGGIRKVVEFYRRGAGRSLLIRFNLSQIGAPSAPDVPRLALTPLKEAV